MLRTKVRMWVAEPKGASNPGRAKNRQGAGAKKRKYDAHQKYLAKTLAECEAKAAAAPPAPADASAEVQDAEEEVLCEDGGSPGPPRGRTVEVPVLPEAGIDLAWKTHHLWC